MRLREKIRVDNERMSHRLEMLSLMPSQYGKRNIIRKNRKEKIRQRIEAVKPAKNQRKQRKKKKLKSNQYVAKIFQGASPLRAAELGSTGWGRFLAETKAKILSDNKSKSPETTTTSVPKEKNVIPSSLEYFDMTLSSPTPDGRGISVENYLTMFRPSIFVSGPSRSSLSPIKKRSQDFKDTYSVQLMVPQLCHVPVLSATDGSRVTMLVTLHDNSKDGLYVRQCSDKVFDRFNHINSYTE